MRHETPENHIPLKEAYLLASKLNSDEEDRDDKAARLTYWVEPEGRLSALVVAFDAHGKRIGPI
jgi:hypothetical protein